MKFRCQLTMLIMEIHKINIIEFKQVFTILIETVLNIIASRIREVSILKLIHVNFVLYFFTYKIFLNALINNVKYYQI